MDLMAFKARYSFRNNYFLSANLFSFFLILEAFLLLNEINDTHGHIGERRS